MRLRWRETASRVEKSGPSQLAARPWALVQQLFPVPLSYQRRRHHQDQTFLAEKDTSMTAMKTTMELGDHVATQVHVAIELLVPCHVLLNGANADSATCSGSSARADGIAP